MSNFLDAFIEAAAGLGKFLMVFIPFVLCVVSVVGMALALMFLIPQSLWFILLLIPIAFIVILEVMLMNFLFEVFE